MQTHLAQFHFEGQTFTFERVNDAQGIHYRALRPDQTELVAMLNPEHLTYPEFCGQIITGILEKAPAYG